MESEDPKWGALFLAVEFCPEDLNFDIRISSQCTRFIHNCRTSNNLHMLLEQTGSRLDHMMSLSHNPPTTALAQCCGALYLTSTVMAHLLANHAPEEVIPL